MASCEGSLMSARLRSGGRTLRDEVPDQLSRGRAEDVRVRAAIGAGRRVAHHLARIQVEHPHRLVVLALDGAGVADRGTADDRSRIFPAERTVVAVVTGEIGPD